MDEHMFSNKCLLRCYLLKSSHSSLFKNLDDPVSITPNNYNSSREVSLTTRLNEKAGHELVWTSGALDPLRTETVRLSTLYLRVSK